MSRRTKILIGGCVVLFCAVLAVRFQKELCITYHRNRLFAAADNYGVLCWQPVRPTTKLDALRILLFRLTAQKEQEAMQHHEEVLLKLGYFEKREFWISNHVFTGEGSSWSTFHRQMTNTFNGDHWWSCQFPETNQIAVTATPVDLARWAKLVSDFDRQQR